MHANSFEVWRSDLNAAEFVELIKSVRNKVDVNNLLTSLPTDATGVDPTAVCNAIAIIQALSAINEDNTSERIGEKISLLSDANLLTDAQVARLDAMSAKFRGVFTSNADRDSKLIPGTNISQNDMILNLLSTSGFPSIQTWNNVAERWEDVYGIGGRFKQIVSAASTVEVARFAADDHYSGTFDIAVKNGTNIQTKTVKVSHAGAAPNVSEIHNNSVGTPNISSVSAVLGGDNTVVLRVTTNTTDCDVRCTTVSLV